LKLRLSCYVDIAKYRKIQNGFATHFYFICF